MQNYDWIKECVAEDYPDHSPAGARSNTDVIGILKAVSRQFSSLTAEIADIFADGAKVAVRVVFEEIHSGECMGIPPSGKKIRLEALEYFRIEHEKSQNPGANGLTRKLNASFCHRKDNRKMNFAINALEWIREPAVFSITEERIEITTKPHTDLWQRTYYHFQNDNAPVLQITTDEPFFSFTVRTQFESKHRFDQCGVVMYLDSENWLKASIEYENETFQHLGSVVTNNGYSDWATTEIDTSIKSMWYRLSRREDDYCIECSVDGMHFSQMRVCHMFHGDQTIRFGIYACSPEDSSFKAVFTDMQVSECKWLAHDGQQPDA